MKKILTILMVLGALMLLVACQPATVTPEVSSPKEVAPAAPASASVTGTVYQVVLENGQFMPADLSVKVGDSVEFVNKDAMEHTVTLENGDFDQKLPMGGKVAYQFNDKGQFRYFCSIHPGMQGMITVN